MARFWQHIEPTTDILLIFGRDYCPTVERFYRSSIRLNRDRLLDDRDIAYVASSVSCFLEDNGADREYQIGLPHLKLPIMRFIASYKQIRRLWFVEEGAGSLNENFEPRVGTFENSELQSFWGFENFSMKEIFHDGPFFSDWQGKYHGTIGCEDCFENFPGERLVHQLKPQIVFKDSLRRILVCIPPISWIRNKKRISEEQIFFIALETIRELKMKYGDDVEIVLKAHGSYDYDFINNLVLTVPDCLAWHAETQYGQHDCFETGTLNFFKVVSIFYESSVVHYYKKCFGHDNVDLVYA